MNVSNINGYNENGKKEKMNRKRRNRKNQWLWISALTTTYMRKFQRLREVSKEGAKAALVHRNRFDANEITRDRISYDISGFLRTVRERKWFK